MEKYQISSERAAGMARCLLLWYDENKRDLPWRKTNDAYAVLVSETMAQQTRIAFLLGYYERFMARFPNLCALAEASEADVLKLWEGLGYYSRARNLHKAAKRILSEFDGQVPSAKQELLSLPGVGEYTAGAILSIAYGQPEPAVDGNVLRVFSRVENADQDVSLPQTRQTAYDFVKAVMPKAHMSRFTQSLMELGALVCKPKNPDCTVCPVSSFCLARQCGRQNLLPVKTPKKPSRTETKTILLIRNEKDEVLMRRRTERLLSGLWEFVTIDEAMSCDEVKTYLKRLGFAPLSIKSLPPAKHVFTHIIWEMTGFDCAVKGIEEPKGYEWIPRRKVDELALPSAIRSYARQYRLSGNEPGEGSV